MMPKSRKVLLTACLTLVGLSSFAQVSTDAQSSTEVQRRSDLGVIVTTSHADRIGLQYRMPIGEKSFIRTGLSYGNDSDNRYNNTGNIIAASDSSVTFRRYSQDHVFGTMSLGLEKQINSGLFSFTGDFVLGYSNASRGYYNSTRVLQEDGEWGFDFVDSPEGFFENQDASSINYHYLHPGLRVGIAMNVPVGQHFLLNFTLTNLIDTRLTLAETNVVDPYNEFTGWNSVSVNNEMELGFGLRFMIPAKKADS